MGLVTLAAMPAHAQWVRAMVCPTRVGISQIASTPPLTCGGTTFSLSAKGNFGGGQTATIQLSFAVANGQYTRSGSCMACNGAYVFDIGGCQNCGGSDAGTDGGTDTTPPVAGVVLDGTGADIDSQLSADTLSANWSGFSDPESGISDYAWAIGTTVGGTEVQGFTSVGTATAATASGLTLTQGAAYYVTVEAMNGAGLTTQATSDGVTVTASTSRLVFVTPPRTLTAGTCGGAGAAITVQLQDSSGAPVMSVSPLGVTAGSSSSFGTWFSDPTCATQAAGGAFTIPAGQASVDLYYQDPNAGSPSISVSNAGGHINPAPQVQTVVAGPPAQLAITTPPRTVEAGTCSGAANPIAVTLLDALGNTAVADVGGTAIVASSSSSGNTAWYQDAACTSEAPGGGYTIPAGKSSVQLFFIDSVAGTPTVTVATAQSQTTPTAQAVTIVARPAAALRWAVEPSTTSAGVVIAPAVEVVLVDAAGSVVAAPSLDVSLALVAPSPSGGTLSGTVVRATAEGRARFDDLAVSQGGTGYQLEARAAGLAPLRSPPFDVTAGPARIATAELPQAPCGRPWQARLAATGDAPISWTGTELPAGMSLDAATGALAWTPLRTQEGAWPIAVTAANDLGSDTQTVSVAVTCDAPPPLRVGCGCGASGGAAALLAALWALSRGLPARRRSARR